MENILIFWWFLICGLTQFAGTLDIADVSAPKLILYPSAVNPFSNSAGITLSCQAGQGAGPSGLMYQWYNADSGEILEQIPRVREQLDNGSLHFHPFSPNEFIDTVHNARYRCGVKNAVATVVSPVFQVSAVIDEQFQVSIKSSSGGGDGGQLSVVEWVEGNPAVLECHGSNPRYYPKFIKVLSWKEIDQFGHEREITDKDKAKYVITWPRGDLLIVQAPLQKLFVCVAQNTLNRQVKSSAPYLFKAKRLSAQNILAPQPMRDISLNKVKVSRKQGKISENSVLDLLCIVTGNPVPLWRWEIRNTQTQKWAPISNADTTLTPGPLLRLRQVESSKEINGTYRCEVSNNFGTSTMEFSVEVETIPEVVIKPERVVAYPGQNVEYSCKLSIGNPEFVWYKNGKPLLSSSRATVSPHQLKLLNVRLGDQGVYQCFTENGSVGTAELIFPPSAPELVHTFISQSVQPGPSISLKCSALGNPAPVISWFIDDLMVSSGSISQSSSSGVKAGENGEGVVVATQRKYLWMGQLQQSRFHFSTDNLSQQAGGEVVSYLNVSSVSVEDSGLYKCRAENVVRAVSHSARLNVYGGIFVREMGYLLTYAHGDTVYIPCHYGGYPVDRVIWQKDSRNLISTGVEAAPQAGAAAKSEDAVLGKYSVFPNGTLRIVDVSAESGSREDKGRYTCVVSNRKGEVASGSVNIDVMHPPQISPMRFEDTLAEGKRTSILCNVISGDLPINISWLKDGLPLPAYLNVTENRVTRFLSVLAFDELQESHSGTYTCLAQNSARLVKQFATLLVRVPPKWTLAPENTKAVLGSEHTLECRAKAVPSPAMSWFRDSNGIKVALRSNHKFALRSNHKFALHLNATQLKIRNVVESDAGLYTCQADNGVGSAIQKSAQLNVIIPARIVKHGREDDPVVVVIAEGADTTLHCQIRGDGPLQVSWKKDSVVLGNSGKQAAVVDYSPANAKTWEQKLSQVNSTVFSAELKIERATLQDAASYECHASNQYGRDEKRIHLQVKARPSAPEDFRVEEIGSRFIRLKWSPAPQPKLTSDPITHFLVQWKTQDVPSVQGGAWRESQNLSVSAYQTSAVIENLHPVTTYGVRVFALNKYGQSLPSAPLVVLTLAEAPSGPPLNLSAVPTGPKTVYVRWKPPDVAEQHGTVQGYHVFAIPQNIAGNQGQNQSVSVDVKLAEETRLQGLRPNMQYRISVSAYNSAGIGPESPYIFIQTPEGAPDHPPRKVECEALSPKSVQVHWEAPPEHLQNGNILGYKVSYISVDGERLGEKPEVKKTSNRETTLHGLKSYTNYSVRVLAYTVGGESEQSESVQCSTEEDIPGEPADLKVLCSGQNSAFVVWLAPKVPNGVVSKYTVFWREAEGDGMVKERQLTTAAFQPSGDGQYSTEIRRLRENTQYKVWVSGWTSAGQGRPSKTEVVRIATSGQPKIGSFPVSKSVAVGEGVTLPCLLVSELPGKVRWFKDGTMETRQMSKNGSLVITRVKDQDEGFYVCRVENEHGSEEIEHRLIISRPPGKFYLYLGYVTSGSIQVHWEAPQKVNPPLLGYLLEWRPSNEQWTSVKLGEHLSSYVVENLKCGTEYQFRIAGVNQVGRGIYSDTVSAKSNGGPPEDKPRLTEILDGNGTMVRIDLSRWPDGGCQVKRVHVEYRRVDEATLEQNWIPVVQYRDQGESGQHSHHHQKVWTLRTEMKGRYEIQVKMENDAGLVQKRFSVESHPEFFRNYAKVLERVEKEREAGVEGGGGKVVPFYTDPHVLVPIVSAVICTAAAAVCLMMVVVRRRNLRKQRESQRESEWKFTGNPEAVGTPGVGGISRQSWLDTGGEKAGGNVMQGNSGGGEIYATLNSTKPIPMTIRDSTVRLHSFGSFDNYDAAPLNTGHLTGQYMKKGKRRSCGSNPLSPLEPGCGMQQVNCQMDFPGRIIEPPQEFRCSTSFHQNSSREDLEEGTHYRKNSRGYYEQNEARLEDVYHDYSYPYHEFPASSSSEMLEQLGNKDQGKKENGRHTLRKSSGRIKGAGVGGKRNSRGDDDLFQ